jgi:hypothetical protein
MHYKLAVGLAFLALSLRTVFVNGFNLLCEGL